MANATEGGVRTELARIHEYEGRHLGFTPWREMTQLEVDHFADLTGDHNFIHVDPEPAARSQFNGTIAHGYLGLAMVAVASQQLEVTDAGASVNYGLDKVRFPAPMPVGARWRAGAEITGVEEVTGGVQARIRATVEVEGSERPAVVAECLVRFYA
jgi:acyl dehydratase